MAHIRRKFFDLVVAHQSPIATEAVERILSLYKIEEQMHDLRHTAAVHRVIAWYRDGADVQRLLPQLATYLGHKDLRSTQHYLTMTPELLERASLRFQHYADPEGRYA